MNYGQINNSINHQNTIRQRYSIILKVQNITKYKYLTLQPSRYNEIALQFFLLKIPRKSTTKTMVMACGVANSYLSSRILKFRNSHLFLDEVSKWKQRKKFSNGKSFNGTLRNRSRVCLFLLIVFLQGFPTGCF